MNKKSGEKDSKEHLHIVGTLLMCEMGINLFEPQIKGRIVEMQQKMNQGKQEHKVIMQQKINRV
jgi:hypothetical protein